MITSIGRIELYRCRFVFFGNGRCVNIKISTFQGLVHYMPFELLEFREVL